MIRVISDFREKQSIARSILKALPEWFGILDARENYIKESTDELMVASFDNGSLTGFLCLKETGRDTVELSVMGVLKEYHRNGIGRALFETAKQIAKEKDYSFICIKAISHRNWWHLSWHRAMISS